MSLVIGMRCQSKIIGLNLFNCEFRPAEKAKAGGQAKSDAYKEALDMVGQGQILDVNPGILIRHLRNLKDLEFMLMKKPVNPEGERILGYWIYGPPGVGKSWYTRLRWGEDLFEKNPSSKWFDGYKGQKVILLEDMEPPMLKNISWHLKVWVDRYAISVEYKGGTLWLPADRTFVVTSNWSLDKCLEDSGVPEETKLALRRRFKTVDFSTAEQAKATMLPYLGSKKPRMQHEESDVDDSVRVVERCGSPSIGDSSQSSGSGSICSCAVIRPAPEFVRQMRHSPFCSCEDCKFQRLASGMQTKEHMKLFHPDAEEENENLDPNNNN